MLDGEAPLAGGLAGPGMAGSAPGRAAGAHPPPPPRRARLGAAGLAGIAAACYLALACLAFWPVPPLDSSHLPSCACGDPEQQAWFLAWFPFALTHGLNPFYTYYLHVPAGANVAIDTSMPLLGVLGAPVTLAAGPVVTYNLLLRLGLAASGFSMYAVLRRYTTWWPAAFAGGAVFAFSPYLVGQARRHLFLVFLPLVPLFIPLIDDWLVRARRTPLRAGLATGLAAGLQYLISPEILLASALFCGVGLLFLGLTHRDLVRPRLRSLARGLPAAVLAFGVLAGYPVWMLLAGPGRPGGPLHDLADLTRYHGSLLAPFLPTSNELVSPAPLVTAGNLLVAASRTENGFYLGVPLFLLLSYLAVRCRRMPLVAMSTVVAAVAFVLSLGPKLTAGRQVLISPMPFALFTHLPLLQNLEAARFSLFIQLAAVTVAAVGLDRVRSQGWRMRDAVFARHPPDRKDPAGAQAGQPGKPRPPDRPARTWAVAAVGLAALVPLIPGLPFPSAPARVPEFFTSRAVRRLPAGAVALTFPYDRAPRNGPMLWQAVSGLRFKLIGGDVFVPGPGGRSTWQPPPPGGRLVSAVLLPGTRYSRQPPPAGPRAVAALRRLCARLRVGVVLVDRSAVYGSSVAGIVRRALQAAPKAAGRLDVWTDVQRDLRRVSLPDLNRVAGGGLAMSKAVARPAAGGSLDGTPAPARRVPAALTPASLAILAATLLALGLRVYFQYTRPGFLLGVSEYDDGPYYGSAVRLVHGVLPYRDFVMVQPPGIALLMSPVALLTGGHTAWGLADARVLTVAASGAGVVLAGLLVRHRGALAALVTCGLVAVSPDSVAAAHTVLVEPWLTLCCLAGAVAVFDGDRLASSRARLLASGAAFGFGGAVEAWAVVPVLVVAALLLPGLRRAGLFLAGVAAGFGVPVLPFAVIAPGGFYRSVIVAQLGRVSPARAPVWSRLADMIGMVSAPAAQRATVLAVAAGIAVAVLAAVTLTWLASREPPPALDRFALATTALVVALFCWADQFYYHFVAFLAPFAAAAIGLTLSRLLAARRPGSSAQAGHQRWPRWVVTTVAGLGIVALAAGQARAESGRPRVIGAVPHAVDRVIPPGACVLTDQVTITLLAGRFLSGVPGCPVMVDSLATDLALSGGRRAAEGAGRVPAVAAVWRQAFQHAQYLLLTHNNPGRIPWTPALRAYASRHFLWVPLRWNGVRLYVRSGLPHPRAARRVAPATF